MGPVTGAGVDDDLIQGERGNVAIAILDNGLTVVSVFLYALLKQHDVADCSCAGETYTGAQVVFQALSVRVGAAYAALFILNGHIFYPFWQPYAAGHFIYFRFD